MAIIKISEMILAEMDGASLCLYAWIETLIGSRPRTRGSCSPAGAGARPTLFSIKAAIRTCGAALALLASCAAQVPLTITGVTNSADFKAGFPQRGSLASIFLTGLQGQEGTIINRQNPLLNELLDVQVWVNFNPAPIVSISFQKTVQQINIQIPWEGERDPLYVEVFQSGSRVRFEGAYTTNGFGLVQDWSALFIDATGHAVVQHAADYSPVTAQNPARVGEYLIAYGTNLGPVINVPQTGYPAPIGSTFNPLAIGADVCSGYDMIVLGPSLVSPAYLGLAPSLVGIYQINFQVPTGVPPGDASLAIRRTLVVSPLQTCHPGTLQTRTITVSSASALMPIAP